MKVYLFGNEYLAEDNLTFKVAQKLSGKIKNVKFIKVLPNEDLPFENEKRVVILDSVLGIKKLEIIAGQKLEKLISSPRVSVHDFDLGFQLKYLKKLKKIEEVVIVGLPVSGKINYLRLNLIFKKLVAQDIQGS